ncbi:MAG: hypothetical protein M3Q29_07665 [Chloroflexota bacterium]|nr:hypothetical protein [Chloroflexota bacterium]
MPAKGEPTGEDRIPTQRVTVEVTKAYKGSAKAGQRLELFQTGGAKLPLEAPKDKAGHRVETHQVILEGDPLYKAGEEYLLMLEQGPRQMMRTISPEGRYRIARDSTLTPMVHNEATRGVAAKPVAEVERLIGNR